MIVSSLLFALVLLLLFSLLKWYHMRYVYYTTGVYKATGPTPIPILGNAFQLMKLQTSEQIDYMCRMEKKHNGIVCILIGYIPSVIITDYKLIEFIMSSTTITKKARNYRSLSKWLAEGLLLSNGEKWKQRRRLLTPAFHFQILETFCDVFHGASKVFVEQLGKEVDDNNKSIDLYPFITLCTLDIICETAMGTKINAQIIKQSKYINSVKELSRIAMLRIVSTLHHFDEIFRFTKECNLEKECLKILHNYTDAIITARRAELLRKDDFINDNSNDIGSEGIKRKCVFLDMLLHSTIDGKPLSNEDIREEVDTFMFEGHDTTASAISFSFFEIAQYPDIQDRLVEEQKEIFGDDPNRPATYADLNNMKYLDLVIKETLRLYPSVPLLGRVVTDDFQFDGMTFKKGMDIGIFTYGIHRNPKFFPEPEKFDPERFSKNNYLGKYPYAYIPFAAGPRNCIGQKFAVLEMKSTISRMLRNFVLTPVVPAHKLVLIPEIILRSGNGIPVQLERRKWF